jgi:hypothetical protein
MLMAPIPGRSSVRWPLSDVGFCAWVAAAEPGDRLVYHRGFLAVDTVPILSRLPEPERNTLKRLASQAWRIAEAGFVHLVQLRHGPGDYSYFAIARPRARGALPNTIPLTITEEAA